MKIKTSELTGAALDWAVAKCEGFKPADLYIDRYRGEPLEKARIWTRLKDEDGEYDGSHMTGPDRLYSRKWEAGGPVIEREKISVIHYTGNVGGAWRATNGENVVEEALSFEHNKAVTQFGPTPLIAAMRCYVASKLGDEVEMPKELK